MTDALIGSTGFVGTTLLGQRGFDACYHSTDIGKSAGHSFDLAICAAAPAQKWIANRDPAADKKNIESLISHLKSITCKRFVLISTVDVFKNPIGVDEKSPVDETGLHAYGLHRRQLEQFVERQFPTHTVLRLPGLIGKGLRKNIIFDFLNNNNVQAIDSRAKFQFYPMANLWKDIQIALKEGLKLAHLTAEPVSVTEVAAEGFGMKFANELPPPPASYDMRSVHAASFDRKGPYQYLKADTLKAIRDYAASERRQGAA